MKASLYRRLWWWVRTRQPQTDAVSVAWLDEHAQAAQKTGIDGVTFTWPIEKVANETSWRQTSRLRKRA